MAWLFGKSGGGALKKHATRVANKRAQTHDRYESIQFLSNEGSSDSIRALITRFSLRVDPSITDQQEKEAAYQGIIGAGEAALEPVREFLISSDTLAWPLKMLKALVSEEEVCDALLELLSKMDTEYERDPQKKIDILASLEERQDPRIVAAALPFVDDANETARFHAAATIFSQSDATSATEALVKAFIDEESVRVRVRILDGFIARGWSFGESASQVSEKLPPGYALNKKGEPRKK